MQTAAEPSSGYLAREGRTRWFQDARYGMFIHWGAYAVSGRGEWFKSGERLTNEEYQRYVDAFDPVRCDMRQWAKLARESGMKYAVMTAKHHDGFCLFDSAVTDYSTARGTAKRDFVREFVEAFRGEGLKVGLYYSLLDWHHPDYPKTDDQHHPLRGRPDAQSPEQNYDRYVAYLHEQVRELVTNYGKLDIMWFDFSYRHMKGEAWRAEELVRMVRSLQPDILVDNRLGGDMFKAEPDSFAGDFHGPEMCIPRDPLVNEQGLPVPWEVCTTVSNSWGYNGRDTDWKSAEFIIRVLANCVSKGGNLLLNVGPTAYGEIDERAARLLREVGDWLRLNGDSIYGSGQAEYEKPEWGRFTQKGNILYAHVTEQVLGHISLKGFAGKIKRAWLLSDGQEVLLSEFWNKEVDTFDAPDDIFMNFKLPVHQTYPLPDSRDTVVALELYAQDMG